MEYRNRYSFSLLRIRKNKILNPQDSLQTQPVRGYAFIPNLAVNSKDQILAATSNGIFISIDEGLPWNFCSYDNSIIQSLSISTQGELLAGTYSGSVFYSSNHGDTWKHIFDVGNYLSTPILSITTHSSGKIFVSSTDGIYYSNDGRTNWAKMKLSANDSIALSMVTDSSGNIYTSTRNAAYRSTDAGVTWKTVYSQSSATINLLSITPQNHLIMSLQPVYPYTQSSLMRSTDNGDNWEVIDTRAAQSIVINLNGYIFTANGLIRRSTNNGQSWRQVDSGLTTNDISYLCRDSLGNIYAAGQYNIWVSSNNGENWTSINLDLPHAPIYSLVGYPMKEIYIGTWGGGVWKSNEFITEVANEKILASQFSLQQNYPNPFNPTTRIHYSLPKSGRVSLKVFDVLGRELVQLVNGYQHLGDQEVKFNASDLPTGIYFYRLQFDSFSETRKCVILK